MNQIQSNPAWLEQFINVYSALGPDNVERLAEVYAPDVSFEDPAHKLHGLAQLTDYFANLFTNVDECRFVVNDTFFQGDKAAVYWTMTYKHRRLNSNKPIFVEGHSQLQGADGYVIQHRDYLDLGAMLYEHIPLLGTVVKSIKRKMAQ